MGKSVSVYRFEYEIGVTMNPWNVCIAAFSAEEAVHHLQKTVKSPIKITSSALVCRLDDVSGAIRQNIIQAFLNGQGKNKPVAEDPVVEPVTGESAPKKTFVKK